MKTTQITFIIFAMIASFTKCSSDDEKFVRREAGKNMQNGEIQFVFNPIGENNTLKFEINNDYQGYFEVDWGDPDNPKKKSYQAREDISYKYTPKEKDDSFVVTVKVPQIKSLTIDPKSTPALKGLYFGECEQIEQFTLGNPSTNTLEILDINNCKRFQNGKLDIIVNTTNFNFNGLKKARAMDIVLLKSIPVDLANFDIVELTITSDVFDNPLLRISDCENLEYLEVTKYYGPMKERFHWGNININNTALRTLKLTALEVENLNLENASPNLDLVEFYFFDASNELKLNKNTKHLVFVGGDSFSDDLPESTTKQIDLTGLSLLEDIKVHYASSLNALTFRGNTSLKNVNVSYNPLIKSLEFNDLPVLTHLYVSENKKLSKIAANKVPKLSNVDISANNINEARILDLYSNLNDGYDESGKNRVMKIKDNPGDKQTVRAKIEQTGFWKIYDTLSPEKQTKASPDQVEIATQELRMEAKAK